MPWMFWIVAFGLFIAALGVMTFDMFRRRDGNR
jgi:hypothetical protein